LHTEDSGFNNLGPLLLKNLAVGSSVNAIYSPKNSSVQKQIVVHRSGQSDVVAFTAICTHQGCTVAANSETFDCPCHGSSFESKSGKVVSGPASKSLAGIPVVIQGSALFIVG
jgi:Rieske Fe-S protein